MTAKNTIYNRGRQVWGAGLLSLCLLLSNAIYGQEHTFHHVDSLWFVHRLSLDINPAYIAPSHDFLRGNNYYGQPMRNSFAAHLKYSFQFTPDTYAGYVYDEVYQGIGLGYFRFRNTRELGNPVALYLFQGARIADLLPRLSLNYEWNFGVSAGWEPFNEQYNSYNRVIGSKVNAYINADFYLDWMISRHFDLNAGISFTHFSNGNTKFPNAGLNTVGFRAGLVYNFNRKDPIHMHPVYDYNIPEFPRHISYDLLLYGAWRRKGLIIGDEAMAAPNAFGVYGFNFAPMYNFGYKFRAGVSFDGVYDQSIGIYPGDYILGTTPPILKPPYYKQLVLGVSGRLEYVMPYFAINLGMGFNVLRTGDGPKGFYQVLALKTELTRNTFLHIGYTLQNFKNPNHLMLGIGFRFHSKYPSLHR